MRTIRWVGLGKPQILNVFRAGVSNQLFTLMEIQNMSYENSPLFTGNFVIGSKQS